uniref:RAB44, member RAS oncogene family n=1 Tax=Hippocampus comes TaxID=109280 RepID=A0A3Q2ZJP5_HIPCM
MGSTRRSRMNGKHTVEMDRETDTGALENDDVLTDVPQTEAFQRAEEEQDFNTTEADPKLHNSPRESNLISATSDVITVSPEQVSPHDTSHVADARSDRDTIACTETFEPDYVPVLVDTESKNKHQLLSNKSNPYNVVMVGDSNVGKTSFMKRAQNGKFFPDLPASAGLDTCLWTVVVDGRPVVLQLWDTAGQERFRSITNQVFHRAHAFLLMYDITSSQSFTAVHYWPNCFQEGSRENVPVLLLGNKSDHVERRVTTEEGQNVAKVYFMECSAVSGDNVIQSLEAVASHKDDGRDETLVLHKAPPKKKAGCC